MLILTDGVMGTIMEPVALPPERSAQEVKALKDQCRWAAVGPDSYKEPRATIDAGRWDTKSRSATAKGRGAVQELAQRGGDHVSGRRGDRGHRLRHLRAYCTLGGKESCCR